MNVGLLINKIGQSLRKEGVKGTFQRVFMYFRNQKPADAFDRNYGSGTAGNIPLWRLNVTSKNAKLGVRYQPIPEDMFRSEIRRIAVDP